jgi:EPS-associated MarR family transcriptional regulator
MRSIIERYYIMNHIINKSVYKLLNIKVSREQDQYQILKSLEQDSNFTQRQLSNNLGVSLGKVNYCLKSLIEKGFIKVNNFRNNKNKIQYSYLLTLKGIEEKARLTLDFIRIKTQEYDTLKQEIESLKQEEKNMDRDLL